VKSKTVIRQKSEGIQHGMSVPSTGIGGVAFGCLERFWKKGDNNE